MYLENIPYTQLNRPIRSILGQSAKLALAFEESTKIAQKAINNTPKGYINAFELSESELLQLINKVELQIVNCSKYINLGAKGYYNSLVSNYRNLSDLYTLLNLSRELSIFLAPFNTTNLC